MISKVEELLKNATGEEFEELQRQLSEYQDKLSELDESKKILIIVKVMQLPATYM